MWLSVALIEGKKLTRRAANSSGVRRQQAASRRWFAHALLYASVRKCCASECADMARILWGFPASLPFRPAELTRSFYFFLWTRFLGTAANQMLLVALGWQMYDLT